MRFLVLGAGMMGSALAFDLARSRNVRHVTIADVDLRRAEQAASKIPSNIVRPIALDVNTFDDVVTEMQNHDCTIGSVSYRYNFILSKAAINAGVHFCDLGGNDDIVSQQRSLHVDAFKRGVTIIPNCGLAPGLVNVLAARGIEQFDSVDNVAMRVGGLPKFPQPPFNYQIVFSVEGLLNEYSGTCVVLRDGKLTYVDAMTGLETIEFPPPFGTMEAFYTSGGSSLLAQMFEGKVKNLDYKTIRYPGHGEKFKSLMETGFADAEPVTFSSHVLTERELFIELLKKKLPSSGPDVILLRVTIDGIKNFRRQKLVYNLIDSFSDVDNITAMMRTTAYPTSVVAQLVGSGGIRSRGVVTPEQVVPLKPLLDELETRGLKIEERWEKI